MRLTILNLLFVLTSFSYGIAQITITHTDLPESGDLLTVSQAVDIQADYQSTGPNHQWDFSHLSYLNQVSREHHSLSGVPFLINFTYGPFASSAYRASYYAPFTDLPLNQLGNFLPIQIGDVYQYTKNNNQRLTLVGYSASISGQGVPIKSDTIETKYIYPLEYGDDYVSSGYTKLDLTPFSFNAKWVQQRKRTSVVDGWGELITPYGTFEVLRVQHKIEERDSLEYDGTAFGLDIPVMYEYEWLAKEEKVPVLKITTTEILGNETIISIEYKDNNYTGLGNPKASNQLLVYPNPASDELMILWETGVKSVQVYHVNGALVKDFSFEGVFHQMDISTLESGMYFISVEKEGEMSTTSFVKR